jgi:hypothetical protein
MRNHLAASNYFYFEFSCLFGAIFAAIFICTVQLKAAPSKVALHELEAVLQRNDLYAFVTAIGRMDAEAPFMPSRFYVARGVGGEQRQHELIMSRAFGVALARKLDQFSLSLVKPCSQNERRKQVELTLNIAEWLKKVPRYGAILLLDRCENIACIPLANLIIDLELDEDVIAIYQSRLSSNEERGRRRAEVMIQEPADEKNGGDVIHEGASLAEIESFWRQGERRAVQWCRANAIRVPDDELGRQVMPQGLRIFLDDGNRADLSTVGMWESKRHKGGLVRGGPNAIRGRAEALAVFRKKVGNFPTSPPDWFGTDEKIYSKTQAAFEQAWRPYRL